MIYIIINDLLILFLLTVSLLSVFLFMDWLTSKYLIEEKENFKVFTIPIEELEKTIAIDEEEKQYLERFKKEVKSVSSEDIEGRRSGEIQENSAH